MVQKRERMEVETDVNKLANYLCGGNIEIDGKDPELKPDSEYPDWLWNLRICREAPHPNDMEPDTWEYWRRVKKIQTRKDLVLKKMSHKFR